MKKKDTLKLGKMRAERGVKRAALDHEPQIRRDMIRFLRALLKSPNGCASLDDATNLLIGKHRDGGRWRASIPTRLRAEGIIVKHRVATSARTARHAGYLTEWRLIDRKAAIRRLNGLLKATQKTRAKRLQPNRPL